MLGDLIASISAGREWLELHSAHLLPDTLVFTRLGLLAAGLPVPERLRPPGAGGIARALIPLSPAFKTVVAGVGRLYERYNRPGPFVAERLSFADAHPAAVRCEGVIHRVDRATVNSALAETVQGRLSPSSLRWMCQRRNTGFVLTHQLLAWLFCVWNDCRDDAPERARHLARRVLWEAINVPGYCDLLAQQTAFLALGGWPTVGLRPLIGRVLGSQDAQDGGWHYFERRLSGASETLSRVCHGESPLLGWPIPYQESQFGTLANAVHDAHRGHATGVSLCALGTFWRALVSGGGDQAPLRARRSRGSTP